MLESLREDVNENNRLLKLILSKGGATVDDGPACLPDGVTFPVTTVEDMIHLEEVLSVPESFSSVVRILKFLKRVIGYPIKCKTK